MTTTEEGGGKRQRGWWWCCCWRQDCSSLGHEARKHTQSSRHKCHIKKGYHHDSQLHPAPEAKFLWPGPISFNDPNPDPFDRKTWISIDRFVSESHSYLMVFGTLIFLLIQPRSKERKSMHLLFNLCDTTFFVCFCCSGQPTFFRTNSVTFMGRVLLFFRRNVVVYETKQNGKKFEGKD